MVKELICIGDIQKAITILRAIDHPLRRKMLHLLAKKTKMSVTDIYEELDIVQTVCSTHLAYLRAAGVVTVEVEGKNRFYSLVSTRMIHINAHSQELARGHSADKIFQQL